MNCSRFLIIVFILSISISCHRKPSDPLEEPVVSVVSKTLTKRQLFDALPAGMSKEDSSVFAQDYITRWVKSQLLLRKAELNLSENEKNLDVLIEEYRTSLLTHLYQQKLLEQKYSPLITSSEIRNYYKSMSSNFKLSEPIIKGIFVKLPNTSPNIEHFERIFRSSRPGDMVETEAYCMQNAKKFFPFYETWTSWQQINSELPPDYTFSNQAIRTQNLYKTTDNIYTYYLYVLSYKEADEIAPLEYVTGKIKSILLNKKRIEFIRQLEEDLYDEGLGQKIIKFY